MADVGYTHPLLPRELATPIILGDRRGTRTVLSKKISSQLTQRRDTYFLKFGRVYNHGISHTGVLRDAKWLG